MSRPIDSVRREYASTTEFERQFKKLTRKERALKDRLLRKINQILSDPEIGELKSHALKHIRGSHVDPYVIVYVFNGNTITFIYVDHHDATYKKAPYILAKYRL